MSSRFPIADRTKAPRDPSESPEFLTVKQQLDHWLQLPLLDLIGFTVLFLAGFLMLVDVQTEKTDVALDGQVLLKLCVIAGCGFYGAYGFLIDSRVRQTLGSFPVLWVVLIIGCFFVASPGSITPRESFASAVAMTAVTLMTVTAIAQLGPRQVLITLFYSLSAYMVLSWASYFLMPSVGIFDEPLGNGDFKRRMAGVGHPNTLGQFSGLTIVLGSILFVRFGQRSMFRVAIMLLAGLALIGSLSRTSMLATTIALAVAFRREIFQKNHLLPLVVLALAGAVGLLVLVSTESNLGRAVEKKLSFVSKTGELSELTSATGRVQIWAFTLEKIAARPITGYGAATSKYYLEEYSSYTHNMILHVAFSTGVIGGAFAFLMCLGRLVALFTRHHFVADGIIAFLLVNGLFENVMFSFLAGLPTILWIVGLCLPHWMPDCSPEDDAMTCQQEDDK